MSPVYVRLQRTFSRDRKTGAAASFLIHAVFFFAGGAMFMQGAEYGVETGGGIEVDLIAAPIASVVEAPQQEAVIPQEDKGELITQPEPVQPPQVLPQPVSGDGSSAVPGKDATTFHSSAGAVIEAKPNYLKNPAPRYPEAARAAGHEGVVLLWARVNAAGAADEVRVQSSSGFPLLDETAVKTVTRWKFQPARVGSMPVDSNVQIPIRFQLDKN